MRLNVISSSFSAFEQIELSRKKSRKYAWMLVLFCATLFALYQTILVINAYFWLSKKHFDSQEINAELMVATICTKQDLAITTGNEEILSKMRQMDSRCDPTAPSLFCLSMLNERERFRLGFPIQNYLLLFENPMIDSVVRFKFNNLGYGNCLTIEMNQLRQGVLAMFPPSFKQQLRMVVHENGTPPVFNSENEIKVDSNTYAALTSKILYHESFRNKKGGCVDEDWKEIHAMGSVNPNITKFKYTLEYCLDQCIHRLTKTYCKCLLPKTMQDDNVDKLPICTSQICNKIPLKESEEMCDCKPTCRSVIFSSIKREFSSENEDLRLSSLMQNWPPEQELDVDRLLKADQETGVELGFRPVLVLRSILTTIKTYEPLIKLEDAFSTIGGIWGLWMGLSVSILLSVLRDFIFNNNKFSTKYRRLFTISKHMFWLPSILAILLICTYQTYITILEYRQFKVITLSTTEVQDSNYFPTVYVCSFENNMYYDENKLNSHPEFKDEIDRWLASHDRMSISEFSSFLSSINTTDDERWLLLTDLKKKNIAECMFRSEHGISYNCYVKIITFETGLLELPSTCAIIKVNDSNNNGVKIQNLQLELRFLRSKIPNKVMNFVLAFHPLVAVPLDKCKQLADFITVFPGYSVDVKYSVTKIERLSSPYTSNCSGEDSFRRTFQLALQNKTQEKYVYNLEECLWMCYTNEVMHQTDYSVLSKFDYKNCGCNLPCSEINLQFKISHASHVYKPKVSQRHFTNILDLEDFLWSGPAIINIERESSHMTVITDHPAVQDDSLVGIIGGLSGLWIGQSILTLLVEMHTFFHAIYAQLTRKKKL